MTLRVDAHDHLWHYTPEEYGWITDEMKTLRRDFLPAEFEPELDRAKVDLAVAVQARQTISETRWLLDVARSSKRIGGVVGWLPIAGPGFPHLLEEVAQEPLLKGLRHVVQSEPAGFLDGQHFNRGISLLEGTSLVYDILIYPHQLGEALRFLDRHPRQNFVIDHMAKPDIRTGAIVEWSSQIRGAAKRPNAFCKVSGLVTEADPNHWSEADLRPCFDTVLEAFGAERLIAGSDWPVLTVACSYLKWWRILENWTLPLTSSEREAILGGTAERIYSFDLPSVKSYATHQGTNIHEQ